MVALIGCATPKASVQYESPATATLASTYETNGLKIIVDPVFDSARSKSYFKADALGMGILPIHILAENNNPNASFLVQKKNLRFESGANPQAGGAPRAVDVHKDTADIAGVAGTALLSGPLLLGACVAANNAAVIQQNLTQAEMRDQTLSPGQSVSGFVYCPIPKGGAACGGVLKIAAPDLHSQEITRLEIPINNSTK